MLYTQAAKMAAIFNLLLAGEMLVIRWDGEFVPYQVTPWNLMKIPHKPYIACFKCVGTAANHIGEAPSNLQEFFSCSSRNPFESDSPKYYIP
ncbi:unnamed protein product [Cuscuta campestris]|uniref:Uncharacterized protein n=1 Tax=Cuscuta campestris TaxID=132261 RepID=A0A484L5J9_9ASTE|nr:unnamed protein product [Cuscuta campestris]